MAIKLYDADIFSSTCQTLVNTVNCVGVMGAGLALEFKQHWRSKSREEYLHAGLKTFMDIYLSEGIESIEFPLLGAGLGGLNPGRSQEIMMSYLENCAIPVEIFLGFRTIREREIDAAKTNQ